MPRRSTRTVEEELTEWLNAPWEEAEKQVDHGFSPRNTPTRSPKINLNLKLQAADAKLLGTLMRGLTLGMRQGEIEAEEQDEVRMSTDKYKSLELQRKSQELLTSTRMIEREKAALAADLNE